MLVCCWPILFLTCRAAVARTNKCQSQAPRRPIRDRRTYTALLQPLHRLNPDSADGSISLSFTTAHCQQTTPAVARCGRKPTILPSASADIFQNLDNCNSLLARCLKIFDKFLMNRITYLLYFWRWRVLSHKYLTLSVFWETRAWQPWR